MTPSVIRATVAPSLQQEMRMLFGKFLSALGAADIEDLVAARTREDRHLDFKEVLPGRKDSDKKEFLADVSAFANSGGGDVVFGIQEERDAAGKSTGIAAAVTPLTVNFDEETRRLASITESGLDAAIVPKVQFREVPCSSGTVIVMRVPKSWTAPHMVRETWRFYLRQGAQNIPMDTGTLRSAFTEAAGLPERIRRFRVERVSRIASDEAAIAMQGPERLVIHLVPLSSAAGDSPVDLFAIKAHNPAPLDNYAGWSTRFNLDGLLLSSGEPNLPCHTYTLYMRNGSVEVVVHVGSELKGQGGIWLFELEQYIFQGVTRYAQAIVAAGASFPIIVLASVVGVAGKLAIMRRGQMSEPRSIDRDSLLLPEVALTDGLEDLPRVLRPLFDSLWQACGYERSQSYGQDGIWRPPGQ
jgi:hypothetical protein